MEKQTQNLALSIDIGGTYIKFGFVHPTLGIVGKSRFASQPIKDANSFIEILSKEIHSLKETLNFKHEIIGIGIGAPGISKEKGKVAHSANVSFLNNVNLIKLLEDKFELPVELSKDSNIAAIGEMTFGAAVQMKNFILITLGTGLGCSVVVNGEILEGNSGLAGEFGHIIIEENGRLCGCGRRGCLETYASGKGVVRTVFELLANSNEKSSLRSFSFNDLNPEIIFQAANDGDSIAILAYLKVGKILGNKISNLFTLFDPEAVILSGGIMKASSLLLPAINAEIENSALYSLKDKTNILLSELGVNDAALLGAACLILNKKEILI